MKAHQESGQRIKINNNPENPAKTGVEEFEKLKNELEAKTKLAEERLNQIKYLQADFDNYRKQFEKEKERIMELANENLIKDLLVTLDDLERASRSTQKEGGNEGLIMLYRNFLKLLEDYGLRRIEAVGRKFDPYHHEAVLSEKSDKEDGTVVEEIQPGYAFKSKIIRPSRVKVACNKQQEVSTENGKGKNNRN